MIKATEKAIPIIAKIFNNTVSSPSLFIMHLVARHVNIYPMGAPLWGVYHQRQPQQKAEANVSIILGHFQKCLTLTHIRRSTIPKDNASLFSVPLHKVYPNFLIH